MELADKISLMREYSSRKGRTILRLCQNALEAAALVKTRADFARWIKEHYEKIEGRIFKSRLSLLMGDEGFELRELLNSISEHLENNLKI